MSKYGPGYRRMEKHLGDKKLKELQQDTLAQQKAAREKVGGEVVEHQDRTYYSNYPPTKQEKQK